MQNPLRFGAAFLLLGLIVAASVAGLVIGIVNKGSLGSKASKISVQAITNPSQESAVKVACAENVKQAAASGVIVTGCKLAPGRSFQQKGDDARVTLLVTDGKTNYTVVTALNKGIWNVTGLQVESAKPAK